MTVQDPPAPPRPAATTDGSAAGVRVIRLNARERIPPLGHQPALDGLRALAVGAVLVYHARFGWATGGFLGVSTFFTLSGFLITSLLLREYAGSSDVDLRRFWSRRFRRLLPASWLTIALVVAMGALGVWTTDQLRDLRSDVPFALAEILNWHFIAQGRTYGADFAAPSPLEHFWSLAIEQQFYLVFPLVMLVLLRAGARTVRREGGGGTRRTGVGLAVAVLGLLCVGSAVLNARWGAEDQMRAYFGTFSRLFELLLGAVLACVMLRHLVARSAVVRSILVALGVAGLAGSVWLWHVASVSADWLYPWGFLVMAACTMALVAGAVQGGPLGAALSWAPLVWLGRISYGVYLLHWPVFLWLSPARVGWAPWPLFALRMAVTLTGAVLMFRFIERPIRLGRMLRGRPAGLAVPAAACLLVAATLVVTTDLPAPTALERAGAAAAGGGTPVSAETPPPPTRVLVLGDELAASAPGALSADGDAPTDVQVASVAACGLALGGWVRLGDGAIERDVDRCGQVRDAWAQRIAAERPEVVVLWAGLRDVADRRFDPTSPWRAPGDPVLDDFLRTEVGTVLDLAGATGARVVVMTAPHVRNAGPAPPRVPLAVPPDPEEARLAAIDASLIEQDAPPVAVAENQDLRIDAWNLVLQQAAASRGVPVVDVAAQMRAWPGGEFDPERRAAGVGVTDLGAAELGEWLAPQLRAVPAPAPPPPSAGSVLDPNAALPVAAPATPRRVVPAGRAVNVVAVGDSVAFNYGFGLASVGASDPDLRAVNAAQLGCPVARGGSFRFLRDIDQFPERCDWAQLFPQFLSEQNPDVVLLGTGIWEIVDRRFPGDDRWRQIGRPEVDRYLLREFLSAIDTLGSTGATVVVATYPHIQPGRDQGYSGLPEGDPARVDRLNQLLVEAVNLRPGVARVIDVQGWLAQQPGGEDDPAKRSDGIHFTDEYSRVIGSWMAPQLVAIGRGT